MHSNDLLCPAWGSLSRTRRLNTLLQHEIPLIGNVLHFSPARGLYRKLKNLISITYYSSDFEDEFVADYHYDITNIPVQYHFFETIICFHILEHVDDAMAIQELYRVLKPDGQSAWKLPDLK